MGVIHTPVNVTFGVRSVNFIDPFRGWISNGRSVLRTGDGGCSWEIQRTPITTGFIREVSFVDAQAGWALGEQDSTDVVLGTRNGGETWSLLLTDRDKRVSGAGPSRSSFAIDEPEGEPDGDDLPPSLLIERSFEEAAGIIFAGQRPGCCPFLKLSFIDDHFGGVLTDCGVAVTHDGGGVWEAYPISNGSIKCIQFFDTHLGWVAGKDGCIWKTTDGGRTWQEQRRGTEDLVAVSVVTPERAYAMAGDGSLLGTRDGGHHWETLPRVLANGAMVCLIFVTEDVGLAGGHGLHVTRDGGQSWEPIELGGWIQSMCLRTHPASPDLALVWAATDRDFVLFTVVDCASGSSRTSDVTTAELSPTGRLTVDRDGVHADFGERPHAHRRSILWNDAHQVTFIYDIRRLRIRFLTQGLENVWEADVTSHDQFLALHAAYLRLRLT